MSKSGIDVAAAKAKVLGVYPGAYAADYQIYWTGIYTAKGVRLALELSELGAWISASQHPTVAASTDKVEGSWPKVCQQRAFVEGMQWWQFHKYGSTAFPSERYEAEAEAIKRYGEPTSKPECCRGLAPSFECYKSCGGTKPDPIPSPSQAEPQQGEKWQCAASKPNYFGGDPQDCNWPHCGCDPNVDRVISGLEECGYEIFPPKPVSVQPQQPAQSFDEWWIANGPSRVEIINTESYASRWKLINSTGRAAWQASAQQSPKVEWPEMVVRDEELVSISSKLQPESESDLCLCGYVRMAHWNPSSPCYCVDPLWVNRKLTPEALIARELQAYRKLRAELEGGKK